MMQKSPLNKCFVGLCLNFDPRKGVFNFFDPPLQAAKLFELPSTCQKTFCPPIARCTTEVLPQIIDSMLTKDLNW